ncbi:MAG: hypothetical protein ACQGVK_01980 [Myxococcota bacterium]
MSTRATLTDPTLESCRAVRASAFVFPRRRTLWALLFLALSASLTLGARCNQGPPPAPGFTDGTVRLRNDGCVVWTEAHHTTPPGAGELESPPGELLGFGPGELTLAPSSMCNEFTEILTVLGPGDVQGDELATGPDPGCDESGGVGCPDPAIGYVPVPGHRAGTPEPPNPFGDQPLPDIGTECQAGLGWSFEDGTLTSWMPTGASPQYPVFGNNVSITRLNPPGFVRVGSSPSSTPDIELDIGGDYWEFSRDVNQHGNWWYGTGDRRDDHTLRPGGRRDELNVGELTSSEFTIAASFISFRLAGSSDAAQRVELQILSHDEADADDLETKYAGIGNVEFPEGHASMPSRPSPGSPWVIVRASAPLDDGEFMGRNVVWKVGDYWGRTARLRIVDAARSPAMSGGVPRMAHVNVDDVRCLDQPPDGMELLKDANDVELGVGHVLTAQPIWGTTETHSHATANLSFGGHMIWGDVADELDDVYSCTHDLPGLVSDSSGFGGRPVIRDPRKVYQTFVKLEMLAAIVSTGISACAAASAALFAIPIAGPILAQEELTACTAALTATAAALTTTPLLTSHLYHGAEMPTSGALVPGPLVQFVSLLYKGETQHVHGMIEEKDFDLPDGTHSTQGLGQFHNHYQKDMIRRAYHGGMRLMVIDVHNSRAMQLVLDGESDYDDWRAIEDHVAAVKRLVAPVGDPEFPVVGPLNDIAEIAYSPSQARSIIAQGKMAIILGVEVMELGKLRSATDTIEQQVQDLWDLGVRKITAIHGANNPLGGTGLFQDVYQSANFFNNLTADENGSQDGTWTSALPEIPFVLPSVLPFPFGGFELGTWSGGDGLVGPSCGASCAWNEVNGGYFEVGSSLPDPGFIGHESEVSFRLGLPSVDAMEAPTYAIPGDGHLLVTPEYLGVNRAHSLEWLLGRDPLGLAPTNRAVTLDGMALPLEAVPPPSVAGPYDVHNTGHFNAFGLQDAGRDFLTEMMKRGMFLDTDHFGQRTRVETHDHTRQFAIDAGLSGASADYAVFGVHTELRGFERGGPYPADPTLRLAGGHENENSKSTTEIAHIAANGGAITISAPGFMDPAPLATNLVENNCDFSSKAYAQKYLRAVELTGGRGTTPGFDMNGFAPHIAPRFGRGTACRNGITADALDAGGYGPSDIPPGPALPGAGGPPMLANWPADWQLLDDSCLYNGSMRGGFWNPACPSTRNLRAQMTEHSGVLYDDYAGREWGSVPWPTGPGTSVVVARRSSELRDDGAPRAAIDEFVAVGGGGEFRQDRAMIKWRNDGAAVPAFANTGWDINLDGMRHVGMLPDLAQDMRNGGVTWELLTPMFNAAEDFIAMWERNCETARRWRGANAVSPADICGS